MNRFLRGMSLLIAVPTVLAGASMAFAADPRTGSRPAILVHLPPGAGATKSVLVKTYPNGLSQDTFLHSGTTATNYIGLAIQTGPARDSSNTAPVWKPEEAGIHAELTVNFPGMQMQVAPNSANQNQYGVFGLAVGRSENARCIYAWQYFDDARETFAGGQNICPVGCGVAPAALRVKLCRSDVSIDDLVAFVKHLSIAIPQNFSVAAPFAERRSPSRARAKPAREMRPKRNPPKADVVPEVYEPPVSDGPRFMAPVPAPPVSGSPDVNRGPSLNPDVPPRAYRGPDYSPSPYINQH